MMQSYETLVEAAQQGDQRAFDELVTRFQGAAREWAFQQLGDAHLAEDAVQEAFLNAYHQLDQLREPKAFPAWLRRIVVSQCHRIMRKASPVTPLNDEMMVREGENEGDHDPAAVIENRELEATLRRAVEDLPAGERAVTELFYIVGYSQQEIAERLALPLTTVKKRLQYARTHLRETMSPQIVARLHLNDDAGQFTGGVSFGWQPVLTYGYAAPDADSMGAQTAADEFEALVEYLQNQQLIPVFE